MMWENSFEVEPYGKRGLYFYEPLATTAPEDSQPYCCYVNTVVFCKRESPPGGLERLDVVSTEWDLFGQRFSDELEGLPGVAPFVQHEGEVYELGGGHVLWREGRWHMRWLGWRLPPDDFGRPFIRE